jgi:hypothetical protein
VVLALSLLHVQPAWSKDKAKVFGTLKAPTAVTAREQALDWLHATGKADSAMQSRFQAIWSDDERPVLDRLAATFSLADPEAARLLSEVQDRRRPTPLDMPAILTDNGRPLFFRANLGLAYARALGERRDYEGALAVLRLFQPQQVADPAVYFFDRAVAEHALAQKTEANRSIIGLMEDVAQVPDRYRVIALLMYQDMQDWEDKDLGDIARKMDSIERRLALARGGPRTQKLEREVIARLDELIKKLEQGGCCPGAGAAGSGGTPSSPMQDSRIATNSGPGHVEDKKLRGLAQQWGKLPEKERAKAMQDLMSKMPERHREVIESYFKKLAQSQPGQP